MALSKLARAFSKPVVARWRLGAQGVAAPSSSAAADVVRSLGAMQAQEYAYAKWSIGQRAPSLDDVAVTKAFARGDILRTHVLRPTWHFVLPEDLRWLYAATSARVHAMNAPYYTKFGVTPAMRVKGEAVIARALEGGASPTRAEIAALLAAKRLPAAGPALAYVLMHAELEGIACSGAPRGKQHTYAAFDRRVPKSAPLTLEEARAILARRYFEGHGPATVRDFAWWSSLPIGEARRALATVAGDFTHREVDGRTWIFAGDPPDPPRAKRRVDLVQGYDELIVGYTESRDVLFDANAPSDGGTSPMHAILVDGQLAGHFKTVPARRGVAIETKLRRRFDAGESEGLAKAITRLERFVGPLRQEAARNARSG